MNDAGGVRLFQGAGNLDCHVQHFRQFHGRPRKTSAQRLAIDEFRRDVVTTSLVTHFVDRENVWMIEGGCRVCFLIESVEAIAILSEFFREQFQRDLAAESRVFSQIDFAHAA